MRLVFVDLDGTLSAGGSEARFIIHLAAGGRIGPAALGRSLLFALRHAPRFGRHVWKKNKAYLAGLGRDDLEAWGRAFALERLAGRLRPEIRARIVGHRAAGDQIVLLTGTPDFLARPLAEAIGAASWIATSCAFDGDHYSSLPPIRHPFADEKLQLARAAAERSGVSLRDCAAYADSAADIALLEAVGTAIAVSPDRKLARRARRAGWEIVAPRCARFLPPVFGGGRSAGLSATRIPHRKGEF